MTIQSFFFFCGNLASVRLPLLQNNILYYNWWNIRLNLINVYAAPAPKKQYYTFVYDILKGHLFMDSSLTRDGL